jgi:hypothetical protein
MMNALFWMVMGAMAVLTALCVYGACIAINYEGADRRRRREHEQ